MIGGCYGGISAPEVRELLWSGTTPILPEVVHRIQVTDCTIPSILAITVVPRDSKRSQQIVLISLDLGHSQHGSS